MVKERRKVLWNVLKKIAGKRRAGGLLRIQKWGKGKGWEGGKETLLEQGCMAPSGFFIIGGGGRGLGRRVGKTRHENLFGGLFNGKKKRVKGEMHKKGGKEETPASRLEVSKTMETSGMVLSLGRQPVGTQEIQKALGGEGGAVIITTQLAPRGRQRGRTRDVKGGGKKKTGACLANQQ